MVECDMCGITPGDLPYELMGLSLEEAEEHLFTSDGPETFCMGCAGSTAPQF